MLPRRPVLSDGVHPGFVRLNSDSSPPFGAARTRRSGAYETGVGEQARARRARSRPDRPGWSTMGTGGRESRAVTTQSAQAVAGARQVAQSMST